MDIPPIIGLIIDHVTTEGATEAMHDTASNYRLNWECVGNENNIRQGTTVSTISFLTRKKLAKRGSPFRVLP